MAFSAGPADWPEWKRFLHLGEQLLRQPTSAEQRQLILRFAEEAVGGHADLWLSHHYYPIPGEAEVPLLLPSETAPRVVQEAFQSHQTQFDSSESGQAQAAALPLINQEDLLGVLYLEKRDSEGISPARLDYLTGLAAHAAMVLQSNRQASIKNWRYEQIQLVRQVAAQIANITEIDELSEKVTGLIQETFDYYYVAIFTVDDKGMPQYRASARQDGTSHNSQTYHVNRGEGIIGTVAMTGKEVLARDVRLEPRYRYFDLLPETRSEFSLPLKVENRILGVLDIQSEQLDDFHEIDKMVLRALADHIATAVEGARLYNTMQRRAEQLSAMFKISHALTSILDLDLLLAEVVQVLRDTFGYTYVHIYTVHPVRRKIVFQAGSGERAKAYQANEVSFDLDDSLGIIPYVARSGQTVLANDVDKDPHYRPSDLGPIPTGSELSIPLKFSDEVLAVMDVQSDQPGAFDQNDLEMLEALSSSIAVAVRNANVYRSEQWRRKVADSFRNVAGLLSANVHPDELLGRILAALEDNLPCDASAIWLVDGFGKDGRSLRLAAARGVESQKMVEARASSAAVRDWLDQAISAAGPVIRKPHDPYGPLGAALEFPTDYSSIASPLRAGERTLGVLTLAHHSGGRYGAEARDMISTFASYAAVAIQNTRLYNDAQEQAWISTVLLQVSEANQTITTLDDLMRNTLRLIPLLVGVTQAAAFLWDESQQAYLYNQGYGIEGLEAGTVFNEQNNPALARLRATRSLLAVHNPAVELSLPAAAVPSSGGRLILLPLQVRGEFLGGLLVGFHTRHEAEASSEQEEQMLSILQGIAHQTAISLENIRLVEARQEEAYVTAVLLQVAQAVVSLNNLNDILDTIVHLMPILVGIDACIIYLWDPAHSLFVPSEAFSGLRQEERELLKRSYAPGEFALLDAVLNHDTSILCPLSDARLPPALWPELPCLPPDSVPSQAMASLGSWLIGVPLSVKGDVYGVLLAKENSQQPGLRERRLEIINGIAQEVALAVQNEHLQREMVERERIEREIQLAREIQRTFLPNRLTEPPGCEVDARWQTARQVGGDFYDVFKLDKNRFGIVIADVADKGMPAALYMTVTRTLIRASVLHQHSPARVLERVNNLLVPDTQNGMFVTAVFAVLNTDDGVLTYANAGHTRPYILRAAGQVEQLPKGRMALGVFANMPLTEQELVLHPGDSILLFTDGVTDTIAAGGEAFGEARLEEVLAAASGVSAYQLITTVEQALADYRAGEPLADDITLLALRRKPEQTE